MNERYDPELEDALRDPELLRLAAMLSSAHTPEPPLDDAFRSALRRQLMAKAWEASERRGSFWSLLSAPPRVAWVGAAAVVALIALVVVQTQTSNGTVVVASPQSGATAVQLQQPILVSFNQPMDHQSTEQAVQIVPATAVKFIWKDDNTLYVQPISGDLAPNTQYQVTVGPTARTKAGRTLSSPTGFRFVTQPTAPPTPQPQPTPTPSSGSLLTNEHQVAVNDSKLPVQWSADSTTLYFVTQGGALRAASVTGGGRHMIVPAGVSSFAVEPSGDRIAVIRDSRIQIITIGTGTVADVSDGTSATAIAWAAGQFYWGGADGVFIVGGGKVASNPDPAGRFVSLAPDGAHAVFQSGQSLLIVDVVSGNVTHLAAAANFQGWSPDGSKLMHDGLISDMTGQTVGRLPQGEPSWSAQGQILVGSDTSVVEVKPDGTGTLVLASGTYRGPVWAPNSTTFAFLRDNTIWVATAPGSEPPPQSDQVAQATAVVKAFMTARLNGDSDKANTYLDDTGRAAYANGGLSLIPNGDGGFRRYFIVATEVDPSSPNTVRFVVRLMFGRGGGLERSLMEETLVLRRATDSDPFLIDRVIAGTVRDVGQGPVVVAVQITPNQVAITFDSDLRPPTISGVQLRDGQGNVVNGSVSYADRTITITGLQLQPGAAYRLVVLPGVQDIGGQNVAREYDLDLVGPSLDTSGQPPVVITPSPAPTPTPNS